ncbi:methyltransferase domain-containing protein [Actomonas aquatica]|uniref:Class I SAM-dependent methyltransferase n=1 Tax=Actomonas aquatica TaxID=2866162 RepID=A0ABZ1C2E2_9BACT|nr:class I SAM-dependent methyltransferase [Opitutus sp. WL0086]WRQ85873.1 class I SAM-dependent methyltransferase [Opitutus sp. WL0086]
MSVSFWSAVRGGLSWLGRRVYSTPWLSGWVYAPEPPRNPEAEYREFNGWYFGMIDQQERMLADGPRMDFYHALIERGVKPGDHVIDLGTGTGVLAAWASRAGAERVWALDHSNILDTARTVAAANGIERVEWVAQHSTDFKLEEKVDLIVHEQMGDYLFDESMVTNVCDLRDRLLKPGGRILPSRFAWFCEPVMLHPERRVPMVWEINSHGYDYSCLRAEKPDEREYYRWASCDLGVVDRFVGTPEPALRLDLETIAGVMALPRTLLLQRPVAEAGQIDGLAVYFEVEADGGLRLSSGPRDLGRAPHWAYRILRTDTMLVQAGDVVMIELEVGRWENPDSWEWSVWVEDSA